MWTCKKSNSCLWRTIREVILYGSVARGVSTKESDIDILVLVDADDKALRDYSEKLNDVSTDISIKYLRVFSIIDIIYQEYLNLKQVLPYYRNISEEGVILYAAWYTNIVWIQDGTCRRSITHFNQYFIHTGEFGKKIYKLIDSAYRIREKCDYSDFLIASKEDSEIQLKNAKVFLDTVKMYLEKRSKTWNCQIKITENGRSFVLWLYTASWML